MAELAALFRRHPGREGLHQARELGGADVVQDLDVDVPRNTIEREWFVAHAPSKTMPQVALAFERFLRLRGQGKINQLLEAREAIPGPAIKSGVPRSAR